MSGIPEIKVNQRSISPEVRDTRGQGYQRSRLIRSRLIRGQGHQRSSTAELMSRMVQSVVVLLNGDAMVARTMCYDNLKVFVITDYNILYLF